MQLQDNTDTIRCAEEKIAQLNFEKEIAETQSKNFDIRARRLIKENLNFRNFFKRVRYVVSSEPSAELREKIQKECD